LKSAGIIGFAGLWKRTQHVQMPATAAAGGVVFI